MVKALLVAAVSSGQGKTTVTAALARKLVRLGKRVRVFKCGPDFIDPMLLERASGASVRSLDLWMVGKELCSQQLAQAAAEADVILIEGVMGLYDGTPSSADLARELLGWTAQKNIDDMCADHWRWQHQNPHGYAV